MKEFKVDVYDYDPLLRAKEIEGFGTKAITGINGMKPDCVILAVGHEEFKRPRFADVQKAIRECAAVVDVKGMLAKRARSAGGGGAVNGER